MKKLILLFIGLITGMVLINLSCSKTINGRTDNLAPLAPLKTDIDAVRGTCIFCNNFRGNENCLSQKHELEHSLTSIGDSAISLITSLSLVKKQKNKKNNTTLFLSL